VDSRRVHPQAWVTAGVGPPGRQAGDVSIRLLVATVVVAATLPVFIADAGPGTTGPLATGLAGAVQPGAVAGYASPLRGALEVVAVFAAPPTPYAAGHRGVDLASSPGQAVLAAGAGRVSFAGRVAGRGVVVIAHAAGVSTEYEPVSPLVHAGDAVSLGQPIGQVTGDHRGCAPGGCLHWGARRAGVYFDPLRLLEPLGPVRLLPWARGDPPG
jgi:murein DD-endopeptidase MepM/ murein hydrolase activator NlpD